MATPTPPDKLDALFPSPEQPGTGLSPTQNPGVSPEASQTLVELLKDNHDRHHIFFNDRGFHNHATHHLYAIYTLGATPQLLEAAYETHKEYQRPAFDPPGDISEDSWKEHFGDERYYRAYLRFFSKIVLEKGIDNTLESYVFHQSANFDDKRQDGKQPEMLHRLLSGVLHPMIHVGYGCEFEAAGMVAEGLAMAAVTHTDADKLYPREFLFEPSVGTLSRLTAALRLSSMPIPEKGVHSFSIVERMSKDPELAAGEACAAPPSSEHEGGRAFHETLARKGDIIRKYAAMWTVETLEAKTIEEKAEELSWLAVILYGIAGLQPEKQFNADFFLMHLVTSSLLLRSYLKHLSVPSQSLLLKTYLSSILAVWVSRGRPALHIKHFYDTVSAKPTPPGPQPTPAAETLVPAQLAPNPWLPILQTTLMHPNEHLPKIQRALAHYAAVYGLTEAGRWAEKGESPELEGAELLDGSLFVRVAGLTADALGWMREGQTRGDWDFTGFWLRE